MTRPGGMRQRGFTLLELLVAVAILGLILAFYGGSQTMMLGAIGRQGASIAATEDRGITARTLRRLLEALDPGGQPPTVQAGPRELRFVTVLPGSDDPVDARLARDAAGRLVLIWSPLLHARRLGPAPLPTITEIASGIAALDFSYWRAGAWSTQLQDGQSPELIRVRITPQKGPAGADLVVAPRRSPPK